MKRFAAAAACTLLLAAGAPAWAQMHHGGNQQHASAASAGMVEGEVRKVDRDAQKITIRHGPIPNLGMQQGMTMVFHVSDPAMLDQVKSGDKIRFRAENPGGVFTVTKIAPAQ